MTKYLEQLFKHHQKKRNSKTSCYTYFRMAGDFKTEDISTLLSLTPFKSFDIGEMRRGGKGKYDFALWSYGYNADYTADVGEQLLDTIKDLEKRIDILNEIRNKYDVAFFLEIVPEMIVDDTHPAIYFDEKIIEFCYLTKTRIDIDMYIYK